MVMWTH